MAQATNCTLSEAEVQEGFLGAPPLISKQIIDLTIKHPIWMRDMYEMDEWPRGNGTVMEQLIFRGAMPAIERGFDQWKKLNNNSGCDPCDGPDCSYNWTSFGGTGFQRKLTELMAREFRSPSYCIAEIQTSAHYEEVMAKIIENLYAQVDFFKEINIGQNIMTGLAKKYIIDSGGPKPNTANPYVYPAVQTTRLSSLNIMIFEFFYEYMRRMPSAVPFEVQDGAPLFAAVASSQLFSHLYRDDPNLRQDARFSGAANGLLTKYNFQSTIRGMFISVPILYPRRFNIVAGIPVEVIPFINGIPADVGAYTGFNPGYEQATHEEVLLHGKYPFKIFYLPTETSLGGNTSFGPEFSFFNSWLWVNPMTVQDPFRRVGYFATSAKIGVAQQYSEAIFGILVERPSPANMATFFPTPLCPPATVDCDNEIDETGCPCPLILSVTPHPITANNYFVELSVPTTAVALDVIQLGVDTGGYVSATVVAVSADGKSLQVTLATVPDVTCDHFTTIFCDNTLGCSSTVLKYVTNCLDATRIDLTLSNPIKADTAADVVTLFYGNGTTASATVVSVNMSTNVWVVDVGATAFCDQVGGIVSVCVPTATDATCPSCTAPAATQCTEE